MTSGFKQIYMDYNATTPVLPEVMAVMMPYFGNFFGNPSSDHGYGWHAKEGVERARCQVAGLLGCESSEVYFTSGGTEANNIAIRGAAENNLFKKNIITSSIEHPATNEPCAYLKDKDFKISFIGVDNFGCFLLDEMKEVITKSTSLITVMHANNETGSIQPIKEICNVAHKHGVIVHTDAAQSAGKLSINVQELGVDLLSIAGHKLYAPKGVGALYVKKGIDLQPVLRGAGHENGLRPGTENVPGIVGLGKACEIAFNKREKEEARLTGLRDDMWKKFKNKMPEIELNGHLTKRLPNTLNIRLPNEVNGNKVLLNLPKLATSTGAACHKGVEEKPSAVILEMGIKPKKALSSIRLSIGKFTTQDEVDTVVEMISGVWEKLAK